MCVLWRRRPAPAAPLCLAGTSTCSRGSVCASSTEAVPATATISTQRSTAWPCVNV
ncbi:hypothetical protein M9458_037052 [Cirrhinus mrigala]|uniref:Secreted protein n=1 Tax=Cirrhinus mrigala TaxID=683832 RepID=A0ABD0P4F3_CIRMR